MADSQQDRGGNSRRGVEGSSSRSTQASPEKKQTDRGVRHGAQDCRRDTNRIARRYTPLERRELQGGTQAGVETRAVRRMKHQGAVKSPKLPASTDAMGSLDEPELTATGDSEKDTRDHCIDPKVPEACTLDSAPTSTRTRSTTQEASDSPHRESKPKRATRAVPSKRLKREKIVRRSAEHNNVTGRDEEVEMIKVVLVRGTQDSTPKRQKVSNSSGGSSGSFPNIPHVGAKAIRLAPSEGVLEASSPAVSLPLSLIPANCSTWAEELLNDIEPGGYELDPPQTHSHDSAISDSPGFAASSQPSGHCENVSLTNSLACVQDFSNEMAANSHQLGPLQERATKKRTFEEIDFTVSSQATSCDTLVLQSSANHSTSIANDETVHRLLHRIDSEVNLPGWGGC